MTLTAATATKGECEEGGWERRRGKRGKNSERNNKSNLFLKADQWVLQSVTLKERCKRKWVKKSKKRFNKIQSFTWLNCQKIAKKNVESINANKLLIEREEVCCKMQTAKKFWSQKNGRAKFSRKLTVKNVRVLSSRFAHIHANANKPYIQLKFIKFHWNNFCSFAKLLLKKKKRNLIKKYLHNMKISRHKKTDKMKNRWLRQFNCDIHRRA